MDPIVLRYTNLFRDAGYMKPKKMATNFVLSLFPEFIGESDRFKYMLGCGKDEIVDKNVIYKETSFKFRKIKSEKRVDYVLRTNDEDLDCIIIVIDRTERTALLDNISYYDECFPKNAAVKKGGILLQVAMKLIDQIKNKYKLRYVTLKDNSRKTCKIVRDTLPLSIFLMFTRGETWYGSHEFVPFRPNDEKMMKTPLVDTIRTKRLSGIQK